MLSRPGVASFAQYGLPLGRHVFSPTCYFFGTEIQTFHGSKTPSGCKVVVSMESADARSHKACPRREHAAPPLPKGDRYVLVGMRAGVRVGVYSESPRSEKVPAPTK